MATFSPSGGGPVERRPFTKPDVIPDKGRTSGIGLPVEPQVSSRTPSRRSEQLDARMAASHVGSIASGDSDRRDLLPDFDKSRTPQAPLTPSAESAPAKPTEVVASPPQETREQRLAALSVSPPREAWSSVTVRERTGERQIDVPFTGDEMTAITRAWDAHAMLAPISDKRSGPERDLFNETPAYAVPQLLTDRGRSVTRFVNTAELAQQIRYDEEHMGRSGSVWSRFGAPDFPGDPREAFDTIIGLPDKLWRHESPQPSE